MWLSLVQNLRRGFAVTKLSSHFVALVQLILLWSCDSGGLDVGTSGSGPGAGSELFLTAKPHPESFSGHGTRNNSATSLTASVAAVVVEEDVKFLLKQMASLRERYLLYLKHQLTELCPDSSVATSLWNQVMAALKSLPMS